MKNFTTGTLMNKKANLTLSNGVRVFGSYIGNKNSPWSNDKYNNFRNHRITFIEPVKGKRVVFEYWSSIADRQNKDESEHLPNAIYCILSGAESYINNPTFDEFCKDFVSISALKAFRGCKKSYEKLLQIGFDDNSISEYAEKYRD
jgi:hypothetical protein